MGAPGLAFETWETTDIRGRSTPGIAPSGCHSPIDILHEEVILLSPFDRKEIMNSKQANLLQGTLDLLVLRALGPGQLHGLGISRRIEQITKGTFLVKPGSLFPALHRMEEAGWLSSFWGESENNRRAKFYRLTKAGKRQLDVETEQWATVVLAMTNALKAT